MRPTGATKKVDVDAIPQVGGQSLLEFDLEATDKPWRLPGMYTAFTCPVSRHTQEQCISGADISDYFNYGLTEETWKLYCEKQRKMRGDVNLLNKIAVSSPVAICQLSPRVWYSSNTQYTHSSLVSIRVASVSRYVDVLDDCLNWKVHVVTAGIILCHLLNFIIILIQHACAVVFNKCTSLSMV